MMRNKMRVSLSFGCLLTAIFIIYRTWGESNFAFSYQKADQEPKKKWQPPKPENVNELMQITRLPVALKKEYLYQSEVVMRQPQKIEQNQYDTKMDGKIRGLDPDTNPTSALETNMILSNRMFINSHTATLKSDPLATAYKLVHIDLKGAPPLISYFERIFPLFRKLGVTGLLIEYEDMFPYWGSLKDLAAYNAYTIDDIKQLLLAAKKFKFEVIPLVQTFGHMEFALKQSTFKELREVSLYPQVICPSQNDTMTLISLMIDQIMALHPQSRWLHIGSDEVYYLASCNYCHQKMAVMNWDKDQLFMNHAITVAKYVKERHNIQPIMWDDMFRQVSEESIRSSGIWKHVEIMIWRYGKDILSELPPDIWNKYSKIFSGVWIASAFKGATGPAQYVSQISHYLDNHISWLHTLDDFGQQLHIRGIALTGWQRYDHFAVLCELLPAAIPSLAMNLLYLQMKTVDANLINRATQMLDCSQSINLELETSYINHCGFPGGRIYEGVQQLYNIHQELDVIKSTSHMAGWLNQYNIDMHFSSPALVETAYQKLQELKHNLSMLRDEMERAFPSVYDSYVLSEWLHLNLRPLEKQADDWLTAARELMNQEVWPRRPLMFNKTSTRTMSYRGEIL